MFKVFAAVSVPVLAKKGHCQGLRGNQSTASVTLIGQVVKTKKPLKSQYCWAISATFEKAKAKKDDLPTLVDGTVQFYPHNSLGMDGSDAKKKLKEFHDAASKETLDAKHSKSYTVHCRMKDHAGNPIPGQTETNGMSSAVWMDPHKVSDGSTMLEKGESAGWYRKNGNWYDLRKLGLILTDELNKLPQVSQYCWAISATFEKAKANKNDLPTLVDGTVQFYPRNSSGTAGTDAKKKLKEYHDAASSETLDGKHIKSYVVHCRMKDHKGNAIPGQKGAHGMSSAVWMDPHWVSDGVEKLGKGPSAGWYKKNRDWNDLRKLGLILTDELNKLPKA